MASDICLNYDKKVCVGGKSRLMEQPFLSFSPHDTPQPPSLQTQKAKQHLTNLLLVRINMLNGRQDSRLQLLQKALLPFPSGYGRLAGA